jgi:hypothetical protein
VILINVCFFDPSLDSRRVWLNDTIYKYNGPFCHCEVEFCSRKVASTIFWGQNATLLNRAQGYSDCYTIIPVNCSRQQEQRAFDFAEKIAAAQVPFSALGLITARMPLRAPSHFGTFCSRLCCEVLQAGDILPWSIQSETISPSGLHRLLAYGSSAIPVRNVEPTKKTAATETDIIDFKQKPLQ